MNKKHSKLGKVLPVVAGLVLGANAFGQAAASASQQAVNDSFFNNRTGDFIFVTDYMHKINRNEKIDVNELIKGGDSRKGVSPKIYAISPQEAIKSRINFLNSARAKQFYSQEQRCDLIGRYESFLSELSREKIAPSKKSLEALSCAVSDGTINPEELMDVGDDIYAIVKEGYDNKVGDYSVFYLTRIVSDKTSTQYEAEISRLEEQLKGISKSQQGKETPGLFLQDSNLPDIIDESIMPGKYDEAVKKIVDEELNSSKQTPQPKNGYKLREPQTFPNENQNSTDLSLITQFNSNLSFNDFIGSLGLRIGSKDLAFGLLVDAALGLDKRVESYSGPLSAGRTAYGTIDNINNFSIGLSGELMWGPMIFGGGIDYSSWIKKTLEEIRDKYGTALKSGINSKPENGIFGKVYGGAEIPLTDSWRIGATIGYSGKDGTYLGLRSVFRLNQPKKER